MVGEMISLAKPPCDTVLKEIIGTYQNNNKTSRELGFPHYGFKDFQRGNTCKQDQQSLLKIGRGSMHGKTLGVLSIRLICHDY